MGLMPSWRGAPAWLKREVGSFWSALATAGAATPASPATYMYRKLKFWAAKLFLPWL